MDTTTRALGIDTDVSQYNTDRNGYPLTPKFESLTGRKPDFVIVKLSEGIFVDPKFKFVYEPLAAPAAVRGLYHYQRSGVSWQLQADNVLKNTPTDCNVIALDIEKIGNVLDAKFFADSSRILRYIQANSKCKVIYYTGQDVYVNYMLPVMSKWYPQDLWFLEFPLWVASWPYLKAMRSPNNNPSLPRNMRGDWKFLQWTDAGDQPPYIGVGSPDVDVFNGPPSDLLAWVGAQQPAPIPDPVPMPSGSQTIITKQVTISVSTSDQNTGVDIKVQ